MASLAAAARSRGQFKLPGGQLSIARHALHLLGNLAAALDAMMDLFLNAGQPCPKLVAAGVEMDGRGAFQMLSQVGLRGPRADRVGQIMLEQLVFVMQAGDPSGLSHKPMQMLFAIGPVLPQHLLAGADGVGRSRLVPFCLEMAELAFVAGGGSPSRDASLLSREHFGKLQDLLHRIFRLDLLAAVGNELSHAAVEHVAFAAALIKLVVH